MYIHHVIKQKDEQTDRWTNETCHNYSSVGCMQAEEKQNNSITCSCKRSAVGCLIEDKKYNLKTGHNSGKKIFFEWSPLLVWTAVWTVNTYSEFQVNIFRNDRNITKCQFSHHNDDNDTAKAFY